MDNETYQFHRNQLIPFAEKHANKVEGSKPEHRYLLPDWSKKWSRTFLMEMDRLAKVEGLVT